MTPRVKPKGHEFNVTVCEAEIPFDADLHVDVRDGKFPLPRAKTSVQRITVMGDTGCKIADCSLVGQPAKPFASMAHAATLQPRDLIIHVGDYNYRGTLGHVKFTHRSTGESVKKHVYDAGDGTDMSRNCRQSPDSGFVSQNAPDSDQPDAWKYWKADFFDPAGELLASAPWIFARGNHELCSRAGPGWFYFLDTSSNLPSGGGRQISCPKPKPKANPFESVVLGRPFRIELGPLHLIVVDSSNACGAFVTDETKDFSKAFVKQLVKVNNLTVEGKETWLVTHRPLLGVKKYRPKTSALCSATHDTQQKYDCITRTLEYAVKEGLKGKLPQGMRLILSGHIHLFQSLTFAPGGYPPQLIVGNGGSIWRAVRLRLTSP